MRTSTTSALLFFLNIVMPPRKSEKAVYALTQDELFSISPHSGPLPYHDPRVTALVWELKYRRNKVALELAATYLREQALAIAEDALGSAVLIPIPMHEARRKTRGYNQCELLCEAIMKITGDSFIYAPQALLRTRNTLPQQGMPRHRRLKNIRGAMEVVAPQEIEGRVCIVIDDVETTGATGEEAARALAAAGASEVHILTLAHS